MVSHNSQDLQQPSKVIILDLQISSYEMGFHLFWPMNNQQLLHHAH